MASIQSLRNAWSIVTELDVNELRGMVQAPFPLAILGSEQDARQWLADALYTDPYSQTLMPLGAQTALFDLPLSPQEQRFVAQARLALLATPSQQKAFTLEQTIIQELRQLNPRLSIIVVQLRPGASGETYTPMLARWQGATEIVVDPIAANPFDAEFIPLLKRLAPEQEIVFGYHLPGLRPALVKQLIRQTSMTNAGYSAATGIAELVPLFLAPGNVADFLVLTKNQALMAYKIALTMGHDISLQEMLAELAGVLGGGFLWRETARRFVGLVPGWGLIPKIAIAYAGTYIIGEAAHFWYAHHRKLTAEQMRALYARALNEGKEVAMTLTDKIKVTNHQHTIPSLRRPSFPRKLRRNKK